MVEEKREKTKQRQQQQIETLSKKKEEAGNVSEQRERDKGWIHVIRVHDTTHLAGAADAHETTPLTRTS